MILIDLDLEIQSILNTLKVGWKQGTYIKDVSIQYIIKDFGVVVYGFALSFGTEVKQTVDSKYKGWRHIHISSEEDLISAKEKLIWNLMRGGYIRYIREYYPSQFKNIIVEQLGDKIIRERLRLWNDEPKFGFFIEENKQALTIPKSQILSYDPAFFDYMPEIDR